MKMGTEDIALDTSIVVQAFRNDLSIKSRIRKMDHIWLPVPVVGEMMIGFFMTQYPSPLQEKFERFVTRATIIDCDRSVADKYGELVATLRGKGSMIPVNDVWIAACCIVHNKSLVTRDEHFQRVPDLNVEMW